MKINIDNNLLDYSDLMVSGSGSTTDWFSYDFSGAYSYRELNLDPWGNPVYTNVKAGTNNESRHSTYTNSAVPINTTKSYQVSGWIKQRTLGTWTSRIYWYLNDVKNATRVTDGVFITTPYFANSTSSSTYCDDDWRLFVAYLRPVGWSGTTNDGGVYNVSGQLTGTTIDYIMNSATTIARWRLIAPYNSDAQFEMLYPRIDVVDGTEPFISTLLSNEGCWREQNTGNTYINLEDNNLLDYSDWDTNLSGSTTHFEQNVLNSVANRVDSIDPFGNNIKVWQNTATAPVFSGGWNTILIACDPNKMYRFSQWVNRKVIGTDGVNYFGYYVFDGNGSRTTSVRISDNLVHNNFYFLHSSFASPENEWVLMIGYIMPQTYTGSTNSDYYGQVYNTGGTLLNKPSNLSHFKFNSGVTTAYIKHRTYSPYKETNTNAINQMCYPRIDVVDGTEPSIATLLSNEGQWRKINDMKINVGDDWKNTI